MLNALASLVCSLKKVRAQARSAAKARFAKGRPKLHSRLFTRLRAWTTGTANSQRRYGHESRETKKQEEKKKMLKRQIILLPLDFSFT